MSSKISRHFSAGIRPERLEGRRLLSASALDNPVVPIDWKGREVRVEAGEYILALNPKVDLVRGRGAGAQIDALDRALGGRGSDARVEEYLGHPGQFLLDVPQGHSYDDVLASVKGLRGFEYLEPNFVFQLEATPNDTYFDHEYGLHNTGSTPLGASTADADIDAPEAWDITTGAAAGSEVVVGVVDSGVDYTHPDLAANMWRNPGEVAGDGVDNDANGYADDVHGINAAANTGNPMDDNGHGTHVAGTIAAVGNNGLGVAGVAWNAKVMGLKFLAADGSGSSADAIECLNYAVSMRSRGVNIRLTSNSWGGGGFEQALKDAVARTASAGMLFVAAAGNGGADGIGDDNDVVLSYPANLDLPNVISVAATDRNDLLGGFSNYGAATVDLAAPGVDIASTAMGGGYVYMSGTSMATPYVAGVAALAWSLKGSAGYGEVRDALLAGVDRVSTLSGKVATGGRLNAPGALRGMRNSLSGNVFDDADGNGTRGGAEAALAGRTVYLDLDNDGALDSGTGTHASANVPVAVQDAAWVSTTLPVSGLGGVVTDVDVKLDITHGYDADLHVVLVAPDGREVELFSAVGGSGDHFTGTVLDDEAATAITAGAAPFAGRYRPQTPLAAFDGTAPDGDWTLWVGDSHALDSGTLRNWSITLTTGEPVRTTDAAGDYSFERLAAGAYTVRQVVPTGWVGTTPVAGYHTVQVVDGQEYSGRIFGTRLDPPPAATLVSAPDVTASGGTYYYFSVRYADDVYVDYRSIVAGNDVSVTGPGGYSQLGSLANLTESGGLWTATYYVTAPRGTWDAADEGAYSISLRENEVSDTSGRFAPAASLGSFNVRLSDTTPPGATLVEAPDVTVGGGTYYYLKVRYSDNVYVDYRSIVAGSDVLVTGPGGYSQPGALANLTESGGLWTATYYVTAPGGTWDSADGGTYSVALRANEVSDISGQFAPAATLGAFNVRLADTTPPDPVLLEAPDVTAGGGVYYYLKVRYGDDVYVDYRSIVAGNDVSVTGPGGYSQLGSLANLTESGGLWTATYYVTAPGGTWDPADAGTYSIALRGNEVSDTSGNSAVGRTLGSFNVFGAQQPVQQAAGMGPGGGFSEVPIVPVDALEESQIATDLLRA